MAQLHGPVKFAWKVVRLISVNIGEKLMDVGLTAGMVGALVAALSPDRRPIVRLGILVASPMLLVVLWMIFHWKVIKPWKYLAPNE